MNTVIIDAGHGRSTPGKRSPDWGGTPAQLFEYEFNLDVARRIQSQLTERGIRVLRTASEKEDDISIGLRVKRVNALGRLHPGAVLVSIHGNASLNPNTGTGWEAFIAPNAGRDSKILATALYLQARKFLTPEGFRIREASPKNPVKVMNLQILRDTKTPAVLTENLFFDNVIDCTFMQSERGRNIITQIHVESLVNYFNDKIR